jgi:hypothetical protein
VTKIFTSGDGGGHFKGYKMLFFWSSFFPRFGIQLENHFLPAHHGFNLCDSHGGAVKRLFIESQTKRGAGFTKTADFVSLIEAAKGELSNKTTAYVYSPPAVDRI